MTSSGFQHSKRGSHLCGPLLHLAHIIAETISLFILLMEYTIKVATPKYGKHYKTRLKDRNFLNAYLGLLFPLFSTLPAGCLQIIFF